MKAHNIEHFITSTDSRSKAAIAERFIRTIKEKILKFLDQNPSKHRYIDVVQELVDSYNKTYHSSIKMAPNDVDEKTQAAVLLNLYGEHWFDEKDAENVQDLKSKVPTRKSLKQNKRTLPETPEK